MKDYLQAFFSPARVPTAPISLEAPLKLAWSVEAVSVCPLVRNGLVFVRRGKVGAGRLVCLDERGNERWNFPGDFHGHSSVCLDEGMLVAIHDGDPKILYQLSPENGEILAKSATRFSLTAFLSHPRAYVGRASNELALIDLDEEATVRWCRKQPRRQGRIEAFDIDVACRDGRLFSCFGDELLSLDVHTGEEKWVSTLTAHGGLRGLGKAKPMISTDRVVLSTRNGTVGLDVEDGSVVWSYPRNAYRGVTDEAVFGLDRQGLYVLEAQTGKVILEAPVYDLARVRLGVSPAPFATYPAVTETHIFAGDERGTCWAMKRKTGEPVWFHQPSDTAGFLAAIAVPAGNRLYINSFSFDDGRPSKLYCYQEV